MKRIERSEERRKSDFHSYKENRVDEIIENKLYLTNYQAVTRNPEMIYELGIEVIVSILEFEPFSDIDKPEEYNNIEIIHFEIEDNSKENIKQFFKRFHDIMESGRKVLVHCYGGISRSATLVISYLISVLKSDLEYINIEDLIDMVKKIRPCINPNPGFIKQLETYKEERINH